MKQQRKGHLGLILLGTKIYAKNQYTTKFKILYVTHYISLVVQRIAFFSKIFRHRNFKGTDCVICQE